MALQTSITAIGSVILQASVNSLGSTVVASITAGSKLYMFFACAYDAMGVTMSTYSGQNIGARKIDRIGQGVKACNIVGIIYSVLALLIIVFLGKWMLLLFVDAGETAHYQFCLLVSCVQWPFYDPADIRQCAAPYHSGHGVQPPRALCRVYLR